MTFNFDISYLCIHSFGGFLGCCSIGIIMSPIFILLVLTIVYVYAHTHSHLHMDAYVRLHPDAYVF